MNDERATETPRDAASPGARRPAGEDDPLGAALHALPAERAGAGFTGRVLARLDERTAGRGATGRSGPPARRPVLLGPAGWAVLAAAVLAVAVGLALVRASGPQSGATLASSGSAPVEAPAVIVPGDVPPPGNDGPSGSLSATTAGSPASAGAATRDDLPAATIPGSPPAAPGPSSRADSGAAGSGGDTERMSATTPAAEAVRLAAASVPEAAGPRRREPDRGPAATPSADARSALERMRAELDALRREHRRFEVALAELPEIGRDGQPVVFLGGDEGLGLVLDLGREATAGEVAEAGERRPSL